MGIQTKVVGSLFLILLVVFSVTTWINTHQATSELASQGKTTRAHVERDALQQADNVFTSWETLGKEAMAKGQMDLFTSLVKDFGKFPGVEDVGLTNEKGLVHFASRKSSLNQPLAAGLFQAAASQSGVVKKRGDDAIVLMHARHYEQNCRICHDDVKVGDLAGVIYLRYSLKALREADKATGAAVARAQRKSLTSGLLAGIGALAISGLLIYFLIGALVRKPLVMVQDMLGELGQGRLDRRLRLKSRDEIGQMAGALDGLADNLQNEVVVPLQKLAAGDVTFEVTPHDDRDAVRGALKQLGQDLNSVLARMQAAGEEIAGGASQVADSSQSLSQGATEQASSLEEITASMQELSSQTRLNAENATQAQQLSGDVQKAAKEGNLQMQGMVQAMTEIRDSSQNISRIIKVIDEIAFQTNLLALNAAVEAARAGQHGKGFAVVAEEVRNLAARSAKAARETAELIEGSGQKTDRGAQIAQQTAGALEEIVNGVTKVTDLVNEIAAASNEQAQGITQVNQGLGQIDRVTQQNTANAEQSAAAAEQLSGQAVQMKTMLQRFRLRATAAVNTAPAPPPLSKLPADSSWGAGQNLKPAAAQLALPAQDPKAIIALDDEEFGRY